MRKQAIRKTNRRLALLGLASILGASIEHPPLKVDVSAPDRGHESSAANGRMPRSGIEADQNETREMQFATPSPIYVRKRVGLPKVGQHQYPLLGLFRPGVLARLVGQVDVQ